MSVLLAKLDAGAWVDRQGPRLDLGLLETVAAVAARCTEVVACEGPGAADSTDPSLTHRRHTTPVGKRLVTYTPVRRR